MHQKIVFLTFMVFGFIGNSLGQELAPEAIDLLSGLACIVDDKTTVEKCGVSNLSCFGESPDLTDYEELESNEDYEACVKEICGINNPNIKDYGDQIEIQTEMNLAKTDEVFDPHMNQVFDQLVELSTKGQQHLADNPELKAKLDKETTLENILMGYRQIFMRENSEIPEEGRAEYGAAQFGWSPQLTESIGEYIKETAAVIESIDTEQLAKQLANSNEVRRRAMGNLEARIRELPDHSLNKTVFRQEILQLQSTSSLSESGSTAYMQGLISLVLNLAVEEYHFNNPRAVALRNSIASNTPDNERQEFKIYTGLENEKDYFKQACSIKVSKTAMLLPSKDELEIIQAKTEATRANILQSIQGKFSRDTQAIMIPIIQQTNIVLPPSREDYTSRLEAFMNEQKTMLNSFNETEKVTFAGHMTNIAGMEMAESLCHQSVETIPNAFAWSTRKSHNHNHDHRNNVSLGAPFANNYEVFGERALAHEFGHIVSYLVQDFGSNHSKNGMKAAKDCLIDNHSSKWTGGFLSFLREDSKAKEAKQEEDYADLFSFMAIPNQAPKMCGLFDGGISILEGENHLDAKRMKLHSPTFFRLLHENTFIGNKLPLVCKNELKENNMSPGLKNCWKRPHPKFFLPGINK